MTDIGKDLVKMIKEPGLVVGVAPHLDVVHGVAQDAGCEEDKAQAHIAQGENNGCDQAHRGMLIKWIY